MSREEEKRKRKRERDEMRRGRRRAEARRKLLNRALGFGVVIAIVGGIGYLIVSTTLSAPSIGPLDSAHDHADFLMSINGERVDFSGSQYQVKSSYVHFENGDGDVIHLHATNVPLGFFLGTIGIRITSTSITLDDGSLYQNGEGRQLRVYANGTRIAEPAAYVIKPLDKILIVYGDENEGEIQELMGAIPNKARDAQGP